MAECTVCFSNENDSTINLANPNQPSLCMINIYLIELPFRSLHNKIPLLKLLSNILQKLFHVSEINHTPSSIILMVISQEVWHH